MRNIFTSRVLLLCFVGVINSVCAQSPIDNVGVMNGILTIPGSGSVNSYSAKRNNTIFDWRLTDYNMHTTSQTSSTIKSPFYQSSLNNLMSPFAYNHDMRSEDGWELISQHFGYNDNGTQRTDPDNVVHLILYNKYTGILRVFFADNTSNAYQTAKIEVGFSNSEQGTALLSASTQVYALDKQDETRELNAVTEYISSVYKWVYADFNMGYDPCTCVYKSLISIKLSLISSATVNLGGDVNANITSINGTTHEGANTMGNENDHYSFHDINEGTQHAVEVFNGLSDFKDNLYESKSETSGTDSDIENFISKLGSSSLLRTGLESLPFAGLALDFIDFFTGGGKESSAPQTVEIMPMALNGKVSLSGTITTVAPFANADFYTPGSNINTGDTEFDPDLYPYYNEILGIFNIIETPTMNTFGTSDQYTTGNPGDPNYEHVFYQTQTYQLAPASDGTSLSYVLNPAARFKSDKIQILGKIQYGYTIPASAGNPPTTYPTADQFHVAYETVYMPMASLEGFKIMSGYRYVSDQYGFSTEQLGVSEEIPTEARLQLLVNLERADATDNTQNVLMKLTYPITINYYPSFTYSSVDYGDYPETLSYSNYTVPSENIKALVSISLGTNVTNGSSSTISFQAPTITLSPGTHFTGSSTSTTSLKSGYIAPGNIVIPAAATSTVKTFCASDTYKNAHPHARIASDDLVDKTPIEEQIFRMTPNPASNLVSAHYYVDTDTNVEILVHDATGRLLNKIVQGQVSKGAYSVTLETTVLPSGIYFFTLHTDTKRHVEKLIIQR